MPLEPPVASSVVPFERRAMLDRLATEPFDVLIVGGGITGAGVALDAASRGLRTALVEAADFASGTSSKSSKLVHGGLRYLQQGDDEADELGRRGPARQDRRHRRARLVGGQVTACQELRQEARPAAMTVQSEVVGGLVGGVGHGRNLGGGAPRQPGRFPASKGGALRRCGGAGG